MWKVNFERKIRSLSKEKFHFLYYPGMQWCYKTLSNFCSMICQMVAYKRLKTIENCKLLTLLTLKLVAVAYERWSVTRGFEYSDLTWELFVFRKTGRWQKRIQKIQKEGTESPHPLLWMKTSLFRRWSVKHCGCISWCKVK